MSAHDKVDVRGQGRRTHRGGTAPLIRPRGAPARSISSRGETQGSSRRRRIVRSPVEKYRGEFIDFRAILIDRGYRLESTLSCFESAICRFLIVAESRSALPNCSQVTVPNVASRTGPAPLGIRVNYDESGRTADRAGKPGENVQRLAASVREIGIHDRTNFSQRCNS
jgi:hypothetical protein